MGSVWEKREPLPAGVCTLAVSKPAKPKILTRNSTILEYN